MATAPNHSANLPREFERCPVCTKKGLFRYGGTIVPGRNGYGGLPPGRRCKYCQHRIPDVTEAEYSALLNRSLQFITVEAPNPRVVEAGSFKTERNPNGSINRLLIGDVEIQRPQLRELTRLLSADPTLCRPPERKFERLAG